MNQNWMKVLLIPIFAAMLVACPTKDPDKITGIDATATPTSLSSGGSSSLNATVIGTGTFNANVNWSIFSGGGSLSSNTGGNVTYTASTVSVQTSVEVKATSAGDANFSKTLTLIVSAVVATAKPVISSFTATPSTLSTSGNVLLVWNVTGATSLSVDQGVGVVTGLTSKSVPVSASKTFTLTATNASGSSTKTFDVTVGIPSLPSGVWDQSNWNAATWQ